MSTTPQRVEELAALIDETGSIDLADVPPWASLNDLRAARRFLGDSPSTPQEVA